LRSWKWPIILFVLVVAFGCGRKADPTLVPSLVATGAPDITPTSPLPTASATLPPPTATLPPTPTPVPLAARVNGEPILLADFEREVSRAGDTVPPDRIMDAMIETVLLEQAAADAGVTVTDEQLNEIIQSDVQALGGQEEFEARLASNSLTQEEYREQVRSNMMAQNLQMQLPIEIPEIAEHVHARHILVATEEEAQAILSQLEDGADFDTLARTFSMDVSTRDRGGDLGFFPRGLLLTPELEEAAFDLAPGQISGIIHSELLGYHIVQVLEREERAISEQDRALIQANQLQRWREGLWADAVIERFVEP
jgi:parvulin-like peptidyl-prolyl isomerase